jgi:uncharacterized protein (TIGR02466 family)
MKNNKLSEYTYFPTIIYKMNLVKYLKIVKEVSEEVMNISKFNQQKNDIYPIYQSNNYVNHPRLQDFSLYILNTAWNVLDSQGYDMQFYNTFFTDMWTQEHYKSSGMDAHTHGFGTQLVGFYFLETPKDCSRVVFHDPRPGKIQIDLPEKIKTDVSVCSQMINFEPKEGDLIISNSYINHSFTRNENELPLKFVHFNITTVFNPSVHQNSSFNEVEVI